MSTRTFDSAIASCRPTSLESVSLPASAPESTAPEYLRDLRAELNESGRIPAELIASIGFTQNCSFAVPETVDRVRRLARAASHIGASRVTLPVETGSAVDDTKVTAALDAARERARWEGVTLVAAEDGSV